MTVRRKVLLALCAATVVLAGCADATQPALDVNGVEISRSELHETMNLIDTVPGESGVLTSSARDAAIEVLIQRELFRLDLDLQGVSISEADREAAAEQTEANLASGQVDEEARDFLQEFLELRIAFSNFYGADVQPRFTELVRTADIEIDPRFGEWVNGEGLRIPGS